MLGIGRRLRGAGVTVGVVIVRVRAGIGQLGVRTLVVLVPLDGLAVGGLVVVRLRAVRRQLGGLIRSYLRVRRILRLVCVGGSLLGSTFGVLGCGLRRSRLAVVRRVRFGLGFSGRLRIGFAVARIGLIGNRRAVRLGLCLVCVSRLFCVSRFGRDFFSGLGIRCDARRRRQSHHHAGCRGCADAERGVTVLGDSRGDGLGGDGRKGPVGISHRLNGRGPAIASAFDDLLPGEQAGHAEFSRGRSRGRHGSSAQSQKGQRSQPYDGESSAHSSSLKASARQRSM